LRRFGLIGYPLGHSFSQKYFSQKFEREGISDASYELFSLESIEQFPGFLATQNNLVGFNVTIPHKQSIIPYLHGLDPNAERIGAVNVIKIAKGTGALIGYNSDYFGFLHSLLLFQGLEEWRGKKALVLGTGGSSKAVAAVLEDLEVSFQLVSRKETPGHLTYSDLDKNSIDQIQLLVHCTPLGMFPDVDGIPPIPFQFLGPKHLVVDLVYNPEETALLRKAKEKGAKTQNGLPMLMAQAEKAWEIWNR